MASIAGFLFGETVKTEKFVFTQKSMDARALALKLMSEHGLGGWHFCFNRKLRQLGLCFYPCEANAWTGRIELSVHYTERASPECLRDTILHEIAHALAGEGTGHGPAWKAICLRIGAKPERCKSAAQVDLPKGAWQAICPTCKQLHHRHRKPKRVWGWFCLTCGPEKGPVIWKNTKEK